MSRLLSKLLGIFFQIFDNVILLQMGRTYRMRFRDFAEVAENGGLQAIERWRIEQQAEWDRLSTTVSQVLQVTRAVDLQ
jgi:hypothetical protein